MEVKQRIETCQKCGTKTVSWMKIEDLNPAAMARTGTPLAAVICMRCLAMALGLELLPQQGVPHG